MQMSSLIDRWVEDEKGFVILDESEKITNGGKGSGNFGHQGRPGEVGGSLPSGEFVYGENPEKLAELRERELYLRDEMIDWFQGRSYDDGYETSSEKEVFGQQLYDVIAGREALKDKKTLEEIRPGYAEILQKDLEGKEEYLKNRLKHMSEILGREIDIDNLTDGDIDALVEEYGEKLKQAHREVQTELTELRGSPGPSIEVDKNLSIPKGEYKNESQRLKIADKTIGHPGDNTGIADLWVNAEDASVKPKIRKEIEKSPELKLATLSQMYSDSGSKLPFKQWLDTPVVLKRTQTNDKIPLGSGFLSFSQYDFWNGVGGWGARNETYPADIITLTIKPRDTLGSLPVYEGEAYAEGEVMVPTEYVVEAIKKLK